MLKYIFKEVFGKLDGSDIYINQHVIMYRKNGMCSCRFSWGYLRNSCYVNVR